jgi:hypothetical protein
MTQLSGNAAQELGRHRKQDEIRLANTFRQIRTRRDSRLDRNALEKDRIASAGIDRFHDLAFARPQGHRDTRAARRAGHCSAERSAADDCRSHCDLDRCPGEGSVDREPWCTISQSAAFALT